MPGGQVRLAAAAARRRDLIGIVEWRVSEAKHSGVEFRYGVLADAATVLAERPDVVVVATGGLPNTSFLDEGEHLVTDTWDVMSGARPPAGPRAGLRRQRRGAGPRRRRAAGGPRCRGRAASPRSGRSDPTSASMNSPAYLQAFAEHDVTLTLARRLDRRAPGRRTAGWWRVLRSDYTDRRGRADRRPRRGGARHAAERRALPRPGAALHATAAPSTTRRCWPCDPQPIGSQRRRRVPAVPDRRRRRQPQHPRRRVRRAPALLGDLTPAHEGDTR